MSYLDQADDYLVLAVFSSFSKYDRQEALTPNQTKYHQKTKEQVNRNASNLTTKDSPPIPDYLLNGEIEAILMLRPRLWNVWWDFRSPDASGKTQSAPDMWEMSSRPGGNLPTRTGTALTPLWSKTRPSTASEDQTDPDVIKAALREPVFNGKLLTGNISSYFCETGAVKASTAWSKLEAKLQESASKPTHAMWQFQTISWASHGFAGGLKTSTQEVPFKCRQTSFWMK